MELTAKARPWVCALPQAGWGGATLAEYIGEIAGRPDASGSDVEIREVLDTLVASGHAQTVEGEVPRWELSPEGHDALIALIEPDAGAAAAEVMLELEPGRVLSSTNAGVQ